MDQEFKFKNPITPSQRHMLVLNKENLKKKALIKKDIKGSKNLAGKGNLGWITVRHLGGGNKKSYRKINFQRTEIFTGIICSIEYDPNRSARIASTYDFLNNKFFYIIAPEQVNVGTIIRTGADIEPKIGYSLPISVIPVGSLIHNVSSKINIRSKFSRAAGAFSRLIEKTLNLAEIELSSGEKKFISTSCYATIGIVSNEFYFLTQSGKAGRSRWLNKRPTVRGVAMNPVDHPHGGGEGKKSGKGKNIWGKPTKQSKKSAEIINEPV